MKPWTLTPSIGSSRRGPLGCELAWQPFQRGPEQVKEVRARPTCGEHDMLVKARTIRAFLAKGHVVLLRHLFRGGAPAGLEALLLDSAAAPPPGGDWTRARRDLAAVLVHYERIAAGLEGLRWRSRGPFLRRTGLEVYWIPGWARCE